MFIFSIWLTRCVYVCFLGDCHHCGTASSRQSCESHCRCIWCWCSCPEKKKEKKRTFGKWSNLSLTVLVKQWRRSMHRLLSFLLETWSILRKFPRWSSATSFWFDIRHFLHVVHIFTCDWSRDDSSSVPMPVVYHFIYRDNHQSVIILLFRCVVDERSDWTFLRQRCSLLLPLLSRIVFFVIMRTFLIFLIISSCDVALFLSFLRVK